jgi:hypothetical protein
VTYVDVIEIPGNYYGSPFILYDLSGKQLALHGCSRKLLSEGLEATLIVD